MLTESVSIGDVLFGCAAVACLLSFLKGRRRLRTYIPIWSVYIVLLIVSAIVGGLYASSHSPFPFSGTEFWRSLAKLSFYGIGAILLGLHVRELATDAIGRALFSVLTLHALIALYIYLAHLFQRLSGIDLPYEFLWFGQGGPLALGSGLALRSVGGIELDAARGIFSEPSTFGIFQTIGLALLYSRSPMTVQRNTWKQSVILVSVLLTFALSSYILLSVFFVTLALKQRQIKDLFPALRLVLGAVILMSLVFALAPTSLSDAFQEVIIHRFFSGFLHGQDRTGTVRLIGSWDTAREIVSRSPMLGSGLGNLDVAFLGTGRSLEYEPISWGGPAIFNIAFYVLGAMGVVGFAIFFLLITRLFVRAPAAGAVFVVAMFASGTFLETTFWVFFVLLAAGRSVDIYLRTGPR